MPWSSRAKPPAPKSTALVTATPGWVAAATTRLEDHALVWESSTGLRALTVVAELLGRVPEPGDGTRSTYPRSW